MYRYVLNGLFAQKTKFDFAPKVIKYDSVVDRSHYVLDSESVRQSILSSGTGTGSVPVYDTDVSKVSDFEVELRSGKLDKADVFQRQLKLQDEIKQADTDDKKAKAKAKAEAVEKARQEHLDNLTGFNVANADKTVNGVE